MLRPLPTWLGGPTKRSSLVALAELPHGEKAKSLKSGTVEREPRLLSLIFDKAKRIFREAKA
jgi:hypothetical protein